jgi:hypothetical protein
MQNPTVSAVTETTGKAFNWKTLLFLTISTILVTLIVSYVIRNEVVIYDTAGNVTQKGEMKPSLKFGFNKK